MPISTSVPDEPCCLETIHFRAQPAISLSGLEQREPFALQTLDLRVTTRGIMPTSAKIPLELAKEQRPADRNPFRRDIFRVPMLFIPLPAVSPSLPMAIIVLSMPGTAM